MRTVSERLTRLRLQEEELETPFKTREERLAEIRPRPLDPGARDRNGSKRRAQPAAAEERYRALAEQADKTVARVCRPGRSGSRGLQGRSRRAEGGVGGRARHRSRVEQSQPVAERRRQRASNATACTSCGAEAQPLVEGGLAGDIGKQVQAAGALLRFLRIRNQSSRGMAWSIDAAIPRRLV